MTTVGARVGQDHPCRDADRSPGAIVGDRTGESLLPVERPKHFVDVDQLRLELDDQQRAGGRVPRELVDDAALPEDREGDLRHDLPTGPNQNRRRHIFRQHRVCPAQQSVGVATSPSPDDFDTDVHRCPDSPNGGQR